MCSQFSQEKNKDFNILLELWIKLGGNLRS